MPSIVEDLEVLYTSFVAYLHSTVVVHRVTDR